MRVVLPCLDFPPAIGGIQVMLGSLARELRNWDLTVIAPRTPGSGPHDAAQPYRVVRVGGAPGMGGARRFVPGIWARLCREVLFRRPDMVVFGHPLLSPVGPALRRLTGTRYVVIIYAMEVRDTRLAPLLPRVFRAAERVVTISGYGTRLVQELGVPADRVAQIPLGSDPARFQASEPSDITTRLGLTGRPYLLTVSRLDERYKGVDTVIRALPLIGSQVPGCRYVVAGDGALRPRLEQLAGRLGCADAVRFLGRVSEADLAALYRDCAAFVLMSRERDVDGGAEGFGLVFLEASSFGRPVLGGNSGGIPDAVQDGVTGLLADPDSVSDVAEKACRLLLDPALSARLGAQGRERALTRMTWAASARSLESAVAEARGIPVNDAAPNRLC